MNRLTFDTEEDQWKFQPLVPAERSVCGVWHVLGLLFPSGPSGGNNGLKNVLNFSRGSRPFDLSALCVTRSSSLVSLLLLLQQKQTFKVSMWCYSLQERKATSCLFNRRASWRCILAFLSIDFSLIAPHPLPVSLPLFSKSSQMKKRPASAVGYKRPISQYARVAIAMGAHSRYRVGVSASVVFTWCNWLDVLNKTFLMLKKRAGRTDEITQQSLCCCRR